MDLILDYKAASFTIHKIQYVSPRVIAELVRMGWRNVDLTKLPSP